MYRTLRPLSAEDCKLMRRIYELRLEHPFYGARWLSKHPYAKALRSEDCTSRA